MAAEQGPDPETGRRLMPFPHPNTTHGLSKVKAYRVWVQMKHRCDNPQNPSYHSYGGRGITYCAEWKTFPAFYADMGELPEGLTLDRIDNNKGYYKENCRWATRLEQAQNRTTGKINSVSGLSGVRYDPRGLGSWVAYGTYNHKTKELYRGKDQLEAYCARKSWENSRAIS